MYIKTYYPTDLAKPRVLITSPHASLGQKFFQRFPQIYQHPDIRKIKDLFCQYVAIEADQGANELAHEVARICANEGLGTLVLEMDYPRAILDGGRVKEHCIRDALPPDLVLSIKHELVKIHEETLTFLAECHKLVTANQGVVMDLHTMASFSPMKNGKIYTQPVGFECLAEYVVQFVDAPREKRNLRSFDLITEDGEGNFIADEALARILEVNLDKSKVVFEKNKPYAALPAFLMNTHMISCPGIAIDIPKHLIASMDNPMDFTINNFQLDKKKISKFSEILARGIIQRLLPSDGEL